MKTKEPKGSEYLQMKKSIVYVGRSVVGYIGISKKFFLTLSFFAAALYIKDENILNRWRRRNKQNAGIGGSDIIDEGNGAFWDAQNRISLEDFYKSCFFQGLSYHREQKRGYLPAGLIEEIKALAAPPIKWDVELAKWFDHHFQPVEKGRTYARLSRRQSSTPDIPRPSYADVGGDDHGRTFEVVLDTSGPMGKKLLAKALGTIANYSAARDVSAVRVVFCDASAYDAGYMLAEEIAETVQVKGRGGAMLQPGIDLLEQAADFPKNGPILIIKNGECDRILIKRKHAFLLPKGKHLPFIPKGEVFLLIKEAYADRHLLLFLC